MATSQRSPDPRALDVRAFCRHEGRLEGGWPLATMARLAAGFSAASDGVAAWSAEGRLVAVTGGDAEIWLALRARAEVPLQCQRCLQTMTQLLEVDRRFRFVRTEDEAAGLDEESEDDVLVLPARLDLHELLEDELILTVPIVPLHEVCPEPLAMPEADEVDADERPNPFAALAALKGRSG
jgi:uncharacterized protein